ncbi:TPR-like protein [Butyriboletus roseoflavus]|nr:TPR-like protein [Butyriboletus roseoflavus]
MSLQGLMSGPECAVPSNPLAQVLKHTEGDRSLQQDRVGGPSSSRLQLLPGSAPAQAAEQDVEMARQFFGGPTASSVPSLALTSPGPHTTLSRLPEVSGRFDLNQAWARGITQQQQPAFRDNAMRVPWTSELSGMHNKTIPGPSAQQPGQKISDVQRPYTSLGIPYNYPMPTTMYGSSLSGPALYQSFNPTLHTTSPDKGKAKAHDADFEAAFARAVASLGISDTNSSARIVELETSSTTVESVSGDAKASTEISEVWQRLQESNEPLKGEDLAKWESEFNQLMTAQREELEQDYGGAMQNAWESGIGEFTDNVKPKFDELGYPILAEYVFEKNNPFLQPSTSIGSPLSEAKALLERNGSLSEAALLLEAAIQTGEVGDRGYEAWILLGETRSMDEREEQGMCALMEGVRRAEAAGADGAGMLSLAISFTNESYDRASYHMLWRWLHARFPTFPIHDDIEKAVRSHSTWDSHDRLTDVFLSLARQQYDQGVIDPDVQVGLGVLFYNKGEYDRAKDCFGSALSQRPQDYLLWNRLGSSLSNGSKPEEALGAYREALSLRPTYTRAIYNVGVACLNIGAHKEAAEHFLSALELQESTGDRQTSDQLWFTLRRAFLQMDRNDLAELARPESRSTLEAFRQHGFEF